MFYRRSDEPSKGSFLAELDRMHRRRGFVGILRLRLARRVAPNFAQDDGVGEGRVIRATLVSAGFCFGKVTSVEACLKRLDAK
jgi:hypothetical protein